VTAAARDRCLPSRYDFVTIPIFMSLHPDFPTSPYAPLVPEPRWFPADETLRSTAYEKLLPPLVAKVRQEVYAWRNAGYLGASPTSVALLRWWFDTEHLIEDADGSLSPFRYYFAQREAVESVIWLYEVRRARDKFDLLHFDASGAVSSGMFDEEWPRYVLKMATGAGKTKVLSLLIAWSFFHKLYEPDSPLSRNFLVIAPNIIVLDRLRADFEGLKIFFNDPILPDNGHEARNWRDDFQVTLHIQDDVRVIRETGNIFLTNIHRVFLSGVRDPSLEDDDLRNYFLAPFGPKPAGKTTDSKTDLGEVVREIGELAVFNDEAHHIHNPKMAWFKSIQDIHHRMLQKDCRLSIQVDVTATPRHDNGAIFVQTVSDYPLVQAIHQNVVKHPVLPDAPSRAKLHEQKSAIFTEKYTDYLALGVEEWKKSYAEHEPLGKKAVLFVMTDDTRNCDEVGAYLEKICPELQGAVLVIHTKNNGEISDAASGKSKEELEILRKETMNEIDVVRDISRKFEQAGIAFMLTGSMAMNYYALPRMTRDIDVVVALQPGDAETIVSVFSPDYYVVRESVSESIARASIFNLVHQESVIKVDCIVRKPTEYRGMEFDRRRQIRILDFTTFIASKEDLIISKLDWAKDSHSETQLRDVKNLVATGYDAAYVLRWTRALGLDRLWQECLND
jgi:type III restriction enzyme